MKGNRRTVPGPLPVAVPRRRFLLAALVVQCTPLATFGQPARKKRVARVGLANDAFDETIRARFVELGFGSDVLDYRAFSLRVRDAHDINFPPQVAQVAAWHPDLVMVGNTLMLQAIKAALPGTSIVFANLQDPDVAGIVTSLARPGGNVTGAAVRYNDLFVKRLELARELSPKLQRVVLITDARNGGVPAMSMREIQAAARQFGISVIEMQASADNDDWCAWARAILEARAEAILPWGNMSAPSTYDHRISWGSRGYAKCLSRLQRETRAAVIDDSVDTVSQGTAMALGEDQHESYRRATDIAVRILKGARPAEIPVDLSMRAQLFINRRVAREMGLEIPQTLLLRADRVVD